MVYASQRKTHVPNTKRVGFKLFLSSTRGKRKVRSGTFFEVHAFVIEFKVSVFIAHFHCPFSSD